MGPTGRAVNATPTAGLADAEGLLTAASLLGKAGRTIESTIAGRSMGDTLPPGTRVRVRCGVPPEPLAGHVVVVAVHPVLFAHRVVGRGRGPRARGYVLTRGDAALLCDEPVPLDHLVGTISECDAGSGWGPLGAPPPRAGMRRLLAAAHRWAMLAALEIHIRVAHGFAVLSSRAARAPSS